MHIHKSQTTVRSAALTYHSVHRLILFVCLFPCFFVCLFVSSSSSSSFFLHISSSSCEVSVQTLYSLIYTSSFSYLTSFCWWIFGGCPADGFSHLGKIRIFVGIVRNVVFLSLEQLQDIWHLWDITHKTGTVQGKLAQMGS
jgi:hypothetical protein